MLACAESDSAQANTAWSRIFREYLRENKFLSKTILACLSGAQMASFHDIKNGKKSRVTAPLSNCLVLFNWKLLYKLIEYQIIRRTRTCLNNFSTE